MARATLSTSPLRSAVLAAALLAAACDSTSPDETAATPSEASSAALLMSDGSVGAALAFASAGGAAGAFNSSFSFPCPGGGTMSVTGQGSRTTGQGGRSDVTWSVTSAQNACRFGTGAQMITLDGSLTGNGTASWQPPAQAGGTPTLLALSLTQSGTLKWATSSTTSSCAISLTTAKQGDQLRSSGTVCGQTVDRTTPLR